MKNVISKLGVLNLFDILKGGFLAAIFAIITVVYQALQNNQLPQTWHEWKTILLVGVGSFFAYLIKNWMSNSQGVPLAKEPTVISNPNIQEATPVK